VVVCAPSLECCLSPLCRTRKDVYALAGKREGLAGVLQWSLCTMSAAFHRLPVHVVGRKALGRRAVRRRQMLARAAPRAFSRVVPSAQKRAPYASPVVRVAKCRRQRRCRALAW